MSTPSLGEETVRPRSGPWLLVVLATLLAFASISTDLYLPAMPVMAASLGAKQSTLELTISGYLIGFSVGQLLWGPVSDRFGRRGPVAVGLVIFVIGSAGCALADSGALMVLWRVVQALGASAGVVLARAMVRDLFERDRAARVLSMLMTVMGIAPLLGPTVGGQILIVAPWQAIFWLLVAIGLLMLLALATIPETLDQPRRTVEPMGRAIAGYGEVLRNRRVLGFAAAGGFYYSGLFAFVAGTPFAFIDYHGLSPQLYGPLFAAASVGMMVANLVNARFVVVLGGDRLLLVGTLGAAITGLVAAMAAATDAGGLPLLAGILLLYCAMNGFVIANVVSGALDCVPARVGATSAVVGAVQYGSGFIGSAFVGLLADGTPWPMGLVIAVSGIGAAASVLLARGGRPG